MLHREHGGVFARIGMITGGVSACRTKYQVAADRNHEAAAQN